LANIHWKKIGVYSDPAKKLVDLAKQLVNNTNYSQKRRPIFSQIHLSNAQKFQLIQLHAHLQFAKRMQMWIMVYYKKKIVNFYLSRVHPNSFEQQLCTKWNATDTPWFCIIVYQAPSTFISCGIFALFEMEKSFFLPAFWYFFNLKLIIHLQEWAADRIANSIKRNRQSSQDIFLSARLFSVLKVLWSLPS